MRPRYKKLLIALLIVVVLGAIALPHISNALCFSVSCVFVPIVSTLIMGVINAFQSFLALLASLFAYLIGWMITFGGTMMTLPVVQEGFKVSLSLVNLMMIIGMIVSAFQIILGVDEHHAKERIKNVIIAALLINFSFLFAGFLLDVSNVFTAFFMKNVTFTGLADAFSLSKLSNMIEPGGDVTTWSGLFAMIPLALFSIAITGLALIIMIAVFLQVLIRNLWVAILLTVMPLAWGCWVFPGLEKYHKDWWENFIKQGVMVLPTITFFLYLTVATAGALGSTGAAASASGAGGATDPADALLNLPVIGFFTNFGSGMAIFLKVMIQMFILGGFLIGGLKISQAAGGAGAAMGMSMAKTVGGAAYRARFKIPGTNREIGLQKAVQGLAGKGANATARLQALPFIGAFFKAAGAGELQNKLEGATHTEHEIDEYVKSTLSNRSYESVRDFKPGNRIEQAAKFKKLSEMGKLEKYLEDKPGTGPGSGSAELTAMADAYKLESHKEGKDLKEIKELVAIRPDLAADLYGVKAGETRESVIQKAVTKLSASEAAKISTDALDNPAVMQAVITGNAQGFVRGIMRDGSSALQQKFETEFANAKAAVVASSATTLGKTTVDAEALVTQKTTLENAVRDAREALEVATTPADKTARQADLQAAVAARNLAKTTREALFARGAPGENLGNLARLEALRNQIITGDTNI